MVIFTYNLKPINMKNLREKYENARAFLKAGKREEASTLLNFGIYQLASATLEGVPHDQVVEGATVDRWKERFWFELEANDLLEE
jgi:hypothetical protein